MQINRLAAARPGPSVSTFPGGVAAAAAALNGPGGASALDRQLKAYQALAGRWREARPSERAALAPALTESPFARQVQSTLNVFTRAAWAGPDAVPPAPQIQILKAFDGLSEAEQKIVAGMQVDASGAPAFPSPADYRARLQADLDATQAREAGPDRRADSVTLSEAAQARLAGGGAEGPGQEPVAVHPEFAQAIAAYSKATR